MMYFGSSFLRCCRGVAAAEMALVTPLLMVIMFGSFELGNYFLSEHVVAKAVRDGARYAGRLPFDDYSCVTPTNGAIDQTRNVTRTGQVSSGGSPRLAGWTNATSITVSVTCSASTNTGIYKNQVGGAPVVKVSATVPYSSLFQNLGFTVSTINLVAEAESPVTGI